MKELPETTQAPIRQFFEQMIPFNRLLGMQLEVLGVGFARIAVPFRDELIGDPARPALHGGVLSATLDAVGGAAAFTMVKLPGDRLSTIDLRVDYLRPADLREVIAEATVSRMGNRVASVDLVSFHRDSPDRHLATGRAVYNIRRAGD